MRRQHCDGPRGKVTFSDDACPLTASANHPGQLLTSGVINWNVGYD
jgi:hypothetical protein